MLTYLLIKVKRDNFLSVSSPNSEEKRLESRTNLFRKSRKPDYYYILNREKPEIIFRLECLKYDNLFLFSSYTICTNMYSSENINDWRCNFTEKGVLLFFFSPWTILHLFVIFHSEYSRFKDSRVELKIRQSRNDFFKPMFPPKNKRTNSTLLLWNLRSTCFRLFFGGNWRHQKDISKLTDL